MFDWNSLLIGAVGGLISGLVVLIAEYFIVKRIEERREIEVKQTIRFKNETRRITGSVFNYLAPGSSIEIMKGELGPPNRKWMSSPELFVTIDEELNEEPLEEKFHTYLYLFKNAHVKVLSRGNETIDVLTVVAWDKDISMELIPLYESDEQNLNVARVNRELIALNGHAEHFPGCRDVVTAIRTFVGNPFWLYVTYFVDPECDAYEMDLQKHPELLVGATITGVCLTKEAEHPSYIYLSELT